MRNNVTQLAQKAINRDDYISELKELYDEVYN